MARLTQKRTVLSPCPGSSRGVIGPRGVSTSPPDAKTWPLPVQGFEIRGTSFWGVLIIRILLFRVLC